MGLCEAGGKRSALGMDIGALEKDACNEVNSIQNEEIAS
jgi:hypothetical protein